MMVFVHFTFEDDMDLKVANDAFLVPDDFDQNASRKEWMDETWKTVASGTWKFKEETIGYVDWLRQKYETIRVEACWV